LLYLDEVLPADDRYAERVTPALLLVVYALAAARVTVLVTEDRITEAPREALLAHIRTRATFRCLARARKQWDREVGQPWTTQERSDFLVICKRSTAEREPYLAYLLTCQWCAGFWISVPAAAAWYFAGDHPLLLVPAVALAISYVTGKLSQFGG